MNVQILFLDERKEINTFFWIVAISLSSSYTKHFCQHQSSFCLLYVDHHFECKYVARGTPDSVTYVTKEQILIS